ncbi:cytochrome P450 CYP12A2-like isoform X1 [Drosophila montana]|uniref:cytochrome P450 CYP12A2-like isoform X1 n=1 Tax=Drosophila montana TaxID=40370 RepID=UPI00313DA4F7
MLGHRVKAQELIRAIPTQKRLQTSAASSAINASKNESSIARHAGWDQARPYSEIPKVSLLHFMYNLRPGGKYNKMQSPNIILDLRRQHGPLFRLPVFGRKEFLVSNDPHHFEQVLRAEGPWPERPGNEILHYHRTEARKEFYKGVTGILSTQGEDWAKFRSSVNPVMMQPKTVRLYYQKMSDVNKEFIQRIRDIRDSSTFEVPDTFEEEINRWTLESVSVVALDKQLGLMNANRDNPQAKKLFEVLNLFFELSGDLEMKPSIWRYVATPKFKKLIKALDDIQEITVGFVNEAVERLEREPSNKPEHEQSVLEKLLKTNKQIAIVMAIDMLMAGVDTTTTAFTGALLCLAKNPEKQAKLREEIRRILPNKDSEFKEASVKNVPYLRACIKESLRLYPLILGNARVTYSDLVLNGYQVPSKTQVLMLFSGLLTDDQHYPRGKEFLPERWLRQSKEETSDGKCPHALKASSPFIYLPFGFGPRMCIGKRIVEMELELGLARLIRNYNVEFNYPTENAFKSVLINVPNIPLKFKFTDIAD